MERTLTSFVRALRSAGVPVSPAESIDAVQALALVGYQDRDLLKQALGPVVAKSEEEQAIYTRLFDLFFARTPATTLIPKQQNPDVGTTTPKASIGEEGEAPSVGRGISGEVFGDERAEAFMVLAVSGNGAAAEMAIQSASAVIGVEAIRFSTQISYYTGKILEQLGVRSLEQALIRHLTTHTPEADSQAEALMAAREKMRLAAKAHVERQFEVFGRAATDNFMNEITLHKPMRALDRRDMVRIKLLIRKMAKKLAVKYGRRPRRKNRGQIDIRKTMRCNAGYDGVPVNVVWRQKRKDRPKIVAICDVSGSVAAHVRFLLLFLYTLNETVRDIHCFAFSHRLREISDLMASAGYEAAFEVVMADLGAGSTDYGQAWSDFYTNHWPVIDRRTTLLVMGDGRNNNGDPRLDIFKKMVNKAKRVIWLCPEAPVAWGTGDSCMLQYKPYCDQLSWCTTPADLERAIDELLSAY